MSAIIQAHFNMTSINSFFDGLGDIIENQIMRHWYDWLNPVKWAQVAAMISAYTVMQPILSLILSAIGDIDAADLLRDGLIDVSGEVSDLIKDDLFPVLPGILERAAALLGGKLRDGATNFDRPKDVKLSSADLVSRMNIYSVLEAYFTSSDAVRAMGFDLGKASTLITWFMNNLVDNDGNAIHLFDPALFDLEELSSPTSMMRSCPSVYIKRRWALTKPTRSS